MNQMNIRRLFVLLSGMVLLGVMGLWLGRVAASSSAQGLAPGEYLPVVVRAVPTATPTVEPTPTREPGENYRIDFVDSINGWSARRWKDGTAWDIEHRTDCDLNNRCGLMQIQVEPRDTYVLAAPMVASVPVGYRVEAMGLFKDGQDKQQWGIVFAADRDGSRPCPETDFTSCFNTFYDLRLRYRPAVEENAAPYLEYRLKRVDSFDTVNGPQGPALKDWTPVDGSDANAWAKLRIEVRDGGRLRIIVNDIEMIEVIDPTFIDQNAQTGVIVANDAKGGVRVKFDYFETRVK